MWRFESENLTSQAHKWAAIRVNDISLTFGDVFSLWRSSDEFRVYWSAQLRAVPFKSYCWECPPVTNSSLTHKFECVFVESPLLASSEPDSIPFSAYFKSGCAATTFESLGRDALLVAPCPGKDSKDFAHLAAFTATASTEQISALWSAVGEALRVRIGNQPVWLSTAGLGVSWLHVRLDSRPKYYRHAPYKTVPSK